MPRFQLDGVLRIVDIKIDPKIFRQVSRSAAGISTPLKSASSSAEQMTGHLQVANRVTKQTANNLSHASRFARSFVQRMAQFAVLLPTFATLNRAIQGSVTFLADFEQSLIGILRIDIDGLASRMDEVAAAAIDIGTQLGVSASEAANSIRVFKQAGETIESSIEKARVATIASKVSTIDLAGAQETLLAVNRQFQQDLLTDEQILDKLVAVEDRAAVTFLDLAEAFRTGGNALGFASKGFDQAIAGIAAFIEQTRKSGREAGTFFKTLATRSLAAGEARNAIEALGVQVENFDGTLRPLFQIVKDVSVAFEGLTEAQRASAAKAIAGVRQFESFLAVVKSIDRQQELAIQSTQSDGTAKEKLAVVIQGLKEQTALMVAEFQKFIAIAGDTGLLDLFKTLVKLTSGIAIGFQEIAKLADGLGLSLAPLIALGGFKLGQRVFGLGTGATGDKAPGGGSSSLSQLANNATQAAQATRDFTNTLKQAGVVQKQSALGLTTYTVAVKDASRASQLAAQAMKQLQVSSVQTSTLRQKLNRDTALAGAKFVAILGAASLAVEFFNAGIDALGTEFNGKKLLSAEEETSKAFLGAGRSFAQTTAFLGPFAGAVAGAASLIASTVDALRQSNEAVDTRTGIIGTENAFQELIKSLSSGGDASKGIIDAFRDTFGEVGSVISAETINVVKGKIKSEFADFDLPPEVINAFDPEDIFRPEFFKAIASSSDEFVNLSEAVDKGTVVVSELFKAFLTDLNPAIINSVEAAKDAGRTIDEFVKTFDNFKLIKNAAQAEQKLLSLREELRQATSTDLSFLKTEVELRKEAASATKLAGESLLKTFELLRETALSNVDEAGLFSRDEALRFLFDFDEAVKSLVEGGEAGAFVRFVQDNLKKANQQQKDFFAQLVSENESAFSIIVENAKNEKAIREALAKESFELEDARRDAAQKSATALREVNDTIRDMGLSASLSNQDLDALAKLVPEQFKAILDGAEGVDDNLRRAVLAIAGDEVQREIISAESAQAKLATALSITQAELSRVTAEIEKLQRVGGKSSSGKSLQDLVGEQEVLQGEIVSLNREAAAAVLESEINKAKTAKEVADKQEKLDQERIKALSKLERAERTLEFQTAKLANEFDRFISDRVKNLTEDTADALEKLAEAEGGVISATEDLSVAYDDFRKSILDFNGAIAQAQITSNLLAVDIANLAGGVNTFEERLSALDNAFNTVLQNANITLEQRIALERQLAEETLNFLQNARNQIVDAGLGVFGQSPEQNRALQEGILGLSVVADKLGGSFDQFLQLGDEQFRQISQELLALPLELRQNILSALDTLPDTVSLGGFSPEELRNALGQVGAGIDPAIGLPSIEELLAQEAEQISKLQDLAQRDAELQIEQVITAKESLAVAEAQLEEAEAAREQANENVLAVRDEVREEIRVLQEARAQREVLTDRLLAATKEAEINQIQHEAELFREQNAQFNQIGSEIVSSINSLAQAVSSRLSAGTAFENIGSEFRGRIPHLAAGNLSIGEAAALLRAGAREKRAMPPGAGLAVANTSEAIIPMNRARGFIPNFQEGNTSPIAAGIEAARNINETVVAAISRSIVQSLANLGPTESPREMTQMIVDRLDAVVSELEDLNDSNTNISSSIESQSTVATPTSNVAAAPPLEDININVNAQFSNSVQVQNLDSLRDSLVDAIDGAFRQQFGSATAPIEEAIRSIFETLRERGIISSFGQGR